MPDSEGFLCDDAVRVEGQVWHVSPADPVFGCEWDECKRPAAVELGAGGELEGWLWTCFCEEHFEQWRARG